MPDMRSDPPEGVNVVAILCSDLHLSMTPPPLRVDEPSWFEAMRRSLLQLRNLSLTYHCPILCSGDIFDTWKSPPELINFALEHLPKMYAIPGQHDLPFHSVEHVKKSAFYTLVRANKITWISRPLVDDLDHLNLYGFGWGQTITEPTPAAKGRLNVALVHAYTWMDGAGYPGAPMEAKLHFTAYKGFDVVSIGDNHKPFEAKRRQQVVFNCGGFMRRNIDEVNHKPRVGLLGERGEVIPYPLDCSADALSRKHAHEAPDSLKAFFREVDTLKVAGLDFRSALIQAMGRKTTPEPVRKFILEALDG